MYDAYKNMNDDDSAQFVGSYLGVVIAIYPLICFNNNLMWLNDWLFITRMYSNINV